MFSIIPKYIIDTNGDILGIFLFLGLIIYFILLEEKTIFSNFLLLGSIIGLLVDIYITITQIKKNRKNRYLNI